MSDRTDVYKSQRHSDRVKVGAWLAMAEGEKNWIARESTLVAIGSVKDWTHDLEADAAALRATIDAMQCELDLTRAELARVTAERDTARRAIAAGGEAIRVAMDTGDDRHIRVVADQVGASLSIIAGTFR